MKHKVTIKSWSHTCGDGCCYTYGTDVFVDGVKVSSGDFDCILIIIQDLLKHFNIEVETDYE
jgi:hypothetical protein